MLITQKKNKNEITLEIQPTGIQYHIKDNSIDKAFFVPFEDITNNTYSFKEQDNGMKNFAIYALVMGITFLIINLAYNQHFWSWIFLFTAPFFYWRFKRSQVSFLVIETDYSPQMYLIKDEKEQNIYDEIIEKRNNYLREQYAEINYDSIRATELKKFEWLLTLNAISENEFSSLKDELMQ